MWKNPLIKFVSFSWIANLCFCYAYEEGRKGEDEEFSYQTDDVGMCIIVWFLWYSYAWIASVTYILCLFCWIIEITQQIKMKILSHMNPQKVCQPPRPKRMKQLLSRDKIKSWVAIEMIKVFVKLFNYRFVSYEAWTVSLQFWRSSMLMCLCYASVIVLLCFCYCFIMLLLYSHWNEIVTQLYSLSWVVYMVLQMIM